MNENKYPSLEWCEKYGHLFPISDTVLAYGKEPFEISDEGEKLYDYEPFIIERYKAFKLTFISNCPDALEIIEWLWDNGFYQLEKISDKSVNDYSLYRNDRQVSSKHHIYAKSRIEALMQAVELVEAK